MLGWPGRDVAGSVKGRRGIGLLKEAQDVEDRRS
jgi:hypothetical protein